MYRVMGAETIAPDIVKMEIEAPLVAGKARAGHFVIVRVDEEGERIPLTIADSSPENGTVTLVVQKVGAATRRIGSLGIGESLRDLVGPLGRAGEILKAERVIMVCGGVGAAPVLPYASAYHAQGTRVITILGARSEQYLIFRNELGRVSDELIITTDDGSAGKRGFVTDALRAVLEKGCSFDLVMAVGPAIMMKAVSDVTRDYNLRTMVSLNSIMIDGTGMCGGCRVTVGGEIKFACVDGPEFDGHLVDFDELICRQNAYKSMEAEALKHLEKRPGTEDGECRLGLR